MQSPRRSTTDSCWWDPETCPALEVWYLPPPAARDHVAIVCWTPAPKPFVSLGARAGSLCRKKSAGYRWLASMCADLLLCNVATTCIKHLVSDTLYHRTSVPKRPGKQVIENMPSIGHMQCQATVVGTLTDPAHQAPRVSHSDNSL